MISVIMSVYRENKEWLKTAIESIINQTYRDFEYIITLDDPQNLILKQLLEEYKLKDNRIKLIINKQNKGLTWCLNNMLKVASGDYIARMDADDISLPDRLEKQLKYMMERKIDLLGCNTIVFNENTEFLNSFYENDIEIKSNMGSGASIPHPTWLVNRKVYDELNGYRDIYSAEDYDFILRTIKHGFLVGNYKEPLLKYRINNNGISKKNALMQKLTSIYLYENFKNIENVKYSDIEKYLNSIKINEGKYFNGEKVFYKYKKTRNPINRVYYLCLILLKYNNYLKYNKFRNIKNKLKSKFDFSNKQYGLRIKHYIKTFLYPVIKEKRINKTEKNMVYLIDVPQFRNLGDHAIAKAERLFFEKNYKDYGVDEIPIDEFETNYLRLKKIIKPEDIIVLVGGGNFGVEYYIMELHRRKIIKNFKNKIILFPQTMYFGFSNFGLKQLEKSAKIYSKNINLLMFAREEKSYNMMQYYFKNNSYLVPDIVLSMNVADSSIKRDKILICLRDDIEGCISENDERKIINVVSNYKCERYDTVIDHNVTLEHRDEELRKCFDLFKSSKFVITDRLHGMIFSVITNTPCIVLKNYNHKVKSVYDTWLQKIKSMSFYNSRQDIVDLIQEKINNNYENNNCYDFNKEFDNMNKIIKEFIK